MTMRYDFIGWGITEACNLACPHCYSSATKSRREELPTDTCLAILDWLGEVGVSTIGWTGGEPLLRKDLEQLIKHAHTFGIESGITTNGILLNRDRAASLKEAEVRSIQISVDGSTAEKNRNIRGARLKDFDLIMEGLQACREVDLRVTLAMVLGRETMDDVSSYIAMARDLGVESVRFCGFVPQGDGKKEEVQQRLAFTNRLGDLATLVEELVEIESPTIFLDAAFGPRPPAFTYHTCIAGVKTFYLSGNGDVYPCTGLLDDSFKVGNIHQRPLAEIADDPKMTEIASFDREQIHGHCRECPYFKVCRGACRGAAFAHTGDLKASFPACLFRAAND